MTGNESMRSPKDALKVLRQETRSRPAAFWFGVTLLAPLVVVVLVYFTIGFRDPNLPWIADILSIAAAAAFLYGAWRSIETRTALATLEIHLKRDAGAPTGGDVLSSGSDLLTQGKLALADDLQTELLEHIRWEWCFYLVGTALLASVLLVSIAQNVA